MPSGFHTWSQTSGTNATADSAINWAEGQAPSSVNDSSRAEMAVLAKWRDDNNGSLTTGGSSTAYTLTTNTVFTTLALLDKQSIAFTANATSGAAPTLNVDSLGAKAIRNSTGVTLPTGALVSGSVYRATYYNTAGEFLLENQPAVLPTNSVVTASITDASVTTAKLADANVTLAKIVNTAASRVLGNPTGSPAAPSEISLHASLAFSGTTLKMALTNATLQTSPGNPASTGSGTAVMMGLGATCTITPVFGTRVLLDFQGYLTNNAANTASTAQARFGTGSAPANGAAASGTAVGSAIVAQASAANSIAPFKAGGIITGLTPGTAYWFDLSLFTLIAGSTAAAMVNVSCSAMEF